MRLHDCGQYHVTERYWSTSLPIFYLRDDDPLSPQIAYRRIFPDVVAGAKNAASGSGHNRAPSEVHSATLHHSRCSRRSIVDLCMQTNV
jgi:hypothetical protein